MLHYVSFSNLLSVLWHFLSLDIDVKISGSKLKGQNSCAQLLKYLCIYTLIAQVGAVCPHCGDTIDGGRGCGNAGATCPIGINVMHNTNIMVNGDMTQGLWVRHLLPREMIECFPKHVLDKILGLARAPFSGSVDLTSASYATSRAVVQACINGHCTYDEAVMELSDRLERATEQVAVDKIVGSLNILKSKGETVVEHGIDVLGFIWSRICSRSSAESADIVLKASTDAVKKVSTKVYRATSESVFYQSLTYFILMVCALGLTTHLQAMEFLRDVVFEPIARQLCDWKVAQEFMCLHFRKIKEDSTRDTNLGNVHDKGQQDTMLGEARHTADAFFRTRGGEPRDVCPPINSGEKKYSGKFDSNATKPCISWNLGKLHNDKHLDDSGCCKFNHFCMQWVSDKGPRGMCGGNHPKVKCNYDASKKLDKPQA